MKTNKKPKFKVGQKVKVIATKEQLEDICIGSKYAEILISKPQEITRNGRITTGHSLLKDELWYGVDDVAWDIPESFLQAIPKTNKIMKIANYFYLCTIGILIVLLIGYANNHQYTNDHVKNQHDSINSLLFENDMCHKAIAKGCSKDTTIVNPVLYEEAKILGQPKTFKVKRK